MKHAVARFAGTLLLAVPVWVGAQGQLNMVCSVQPPWCEGAANAFTKETGIKVSIQQKSAGEAMEGAMLIEPTESIGRSDLDAFAEAMIDIDREAQENPELVVNAPHSTRIGRLDEAAAARKPVLRWRPDTETVARSA